MTPYEAAASLSSEQLDALLELNDRGLRACLYNERAERLALSASIDAVIAAAAAPDPPYDQLSDDDTAADIDRLLGDDA